MTRFCKVNQKIARLGKPSLVFGWGQQKRFDLVKKYVNFKSKRVLDVGCGIGTYTKKFFEEGAEVFGIDVDGEKIQKAKRFSPTINFLVGKAEDLPFENNFFDVVFLHEVLEHVKDDKKTILESLRVLKPSGKIIIFAPNKFFPFETHGMYLGKRYIFGNIPFLSWAPQFIRNLLIPHVRIYTVKALKQLFKRNGIKLPCIFGEVDYVWPAFDKIERKLPRTGKILKKFANFAEKNRFLKKFGISIFMVVEKRLNDKI